MTILSVVKERVCYVQNSVISGNGYDRYSVMHIEKYFLNGREKQIFSCPVVKNINLMSC